MNSNIRIFVLSIIGSFLAPATAQMWCPPGAVWEDNITNWAGQGCQTRRHIGDTLVDGFSCEHIEIVTTIQYSFNGTIHSTWGSTLTREANGVVFQQVVIGSERWWDTLYWFTAPIGARWYPPGIGELGACNGFAGMVEVLSITEQVINGLALEVRTLGVLDVDGEVIGEVLEMTERIGTPLMFIPNTCNVLGQSGNSLRYSDDLWAGFYSEETSNCARFNSVHEIHDTQQHTLSFAPDARTLRIHVQGGNGGLYTLHDVRGNVLQEGRYTEGTTTVHVGQLPTAIYLMRLTSSTGEHKVLKFHVP